MIRRIFILVTAMLAAGCVQRTITINTEPQGAIVYLNDTEVGRTPTTVPFTFYGEYDVRIEKEGYQILTTTKKAHAPLHDTIGVDLITEAMPWTTKVNLDWMFQLQPELTVDEDLTVDRGRQLRALLNQEAEKAAE